MEKKTYFYVSAKSVMTWFVAICMVCSAVARVLFVGVKGTDVWSQILLPMVATVLYGLLCLINGKERFYKTAIPIWMLFAPSAFVVFAYDFGKYDMLMGCLFTVAMVFCAVLYTQITCGKVAATYLIWPIALFPFLSLLYLNRDIVTAMDWQDMSFLLPDALVVLALF